MGPFMISLASLLIKLYENNTSCMMETRAFINIKKSTQENIERRHEGNTDNERGKFRPNQGRINYKNKCRTK